MGKVRISPTTMIKNLKKLYFYQISKKKKKEKRVNNLKFFLLKWCYGATSVGIQNLFCNNILVVGYKIVKDLGIVRCQKFRRIKKVIDRLCQKAVWKIMNTNWITIVFNKNITNKIINIRSHYDWKKVSSLVFWSLVMKEKIGWY